MLRSTRPFRSPKVTSKFVLSIIGDRIGDKTREDLPNGRNLSEKLLEGKYLILTEEKDLSPPEAVRAHKELSEVERIFRRLKRTSHTSLRIWLFHTPTRILTDNTRWRIS